MTTASELAARLRNDARQWDDRTLMIDAANLLDQQAQRVAALEAKCALLAASLAQEERDSAALKDDIEAQIRIAKEAVQAAATWRRLLQAITEEIDDREYAGPWRGLENAPGHGHDIPGIWDSDNGRKAGKQCAWCLVWNEARAALAQKEKPTC